MQNKNILVNSPALLSMGAAAAQLGISMRMLRTMMKAGSINFVQPSGPNGHKKIPAGEIARIREAR